MHSDGPLSAGAAPATAAAQAPYAVGLGRAIDSRWRARATRYAAALALASATVLSQWALYRLIGNQLPFLFFVTAVAVAALGLGRGPAVLVVATAVAHTAQTLSPHGHWLEMSPADRVGLLAFLGVSGLLIAIAGRTRLTSFSALEAQRRLQLAEENAGVAVFEVDLSERRVWASPHLRRLLHLEHLRKDSELLAALLALYEGRLVCGLGKPADFECEHRIDEAGGRLRWALSKVEVECNDGGRPSRLRGAVVDITERKRLDSELHAARETMEQQVADLQRLHDMSGRLLERTSLDEQLAEILKTLTELHGTPKAVVSLVEPGTQRLRVRAQLGFAPGALDEVMEVARGQGACGRAWAEQRRVVVVDTETDPCFEAYRAFAGRQGFRAVHSIPLLAPSGQVMGVISLHLPAPGAPDARCTRLADICARKAAMLVERAQAMAQAKAVEQRFELVLESAAVPFSVLAPVSDDRGCIVDFRWDYVNTAAADSLGLPAQALVGQRLGQVFPGVWREAGLLAHYAEVVQTGRVREFELKASAGGKDGWFHVIASPLQGAVAVWYADVSQYRRQELALKEADRRKDEFLAVLAHELRNPLAPIRQAAAVAKAAASSASQQRWSLEVIERQVTHMALLLDDLLDVSRITRGALHVRMVRADLASIIDAAVETVRPLISSKRHVLELALPTQAIQVQADPLRLSQVLANLLTNAAKYTDPEGHIRLEVSHTDEEVSLSVIDNGIGLQEADLQRVFDMFAQVGHAQDRSNGGLGIGLALAKGLVALHGGTLEAHSDGLDHGSRFVIRLPRLAACADPQPSADQPLGAAASPSRTILLADDNRDAADSLAEILRLEGHEVKVAYDGQAALEAFLATPFDWVLLDLGMPRLSGTEAAARIRQAPGGQQAVLLAVTGWGQDDDRRRVSDAGFDHHLTKPVDLAQLAALLSTGSRSVAGGRQAELKNI